MLQCFSAPVLRISRSLLKHHWASMNRRRMTASWTCIPSCCISWTNQRDRVGLKCGISWPFWRPKTSFCSSLPLYMAPCRCRWDLRPGASAPSNADWYALSVGGCKRGSKSPADLWDLKSLSEIETLRIPPAFASAASVPQWICILLFYAHGQPQICIFVFGIWGELTL